MKHIVRILFVSGICAVVILAGFTVMRVAVPSYHSAPSLLGQYGITAQQREASAHAPLTEACFLPAVKAQIAKDKCIANCNAGCNGWCKGVEAISGCYVGCAVMKDYATGASSYE
ncbi:MAG: hypothetical protein JW943_04280 [Deltaproteobacteria bacterium]|nr:hypothetical protein [Deltaproteobacteria bacterium]